MATKAVRFSDREEEMISDFLTKNPYFDFSTLTRMALLNFIQNPSLKLESTKLKSNKTVKIKSKSKDNQKHGTK